MTEEIGLKEIEWIEIAILVFFDDDAIAFEKGVRFVTRQKEFILVLGNNDCRPFRYFPPVSEINVIWKRQFTESHKCEETGV